MALLKQTYDLSLYEHFFLNEVPGLKGSRLHFYPRSYKKGKYKTSMFRDSQKVQFYWKDIVERQNFTQSTTILTDKYLQNNNSQRI